jgi:pimeloyl-ACP methyl ester carboxylesterase
LSPQNWLHHWGRSPDPVTVPTLILWSEEDAFLTRKLTEGMERLIAAPFNLKFISHCGHWMQQEVPHTVNRELLNFFRSPVLTGGKKSL